MPQLIRKIVWDVYEDSGSLLRIQVLSPNSGKLAEYRCRNCCRWLDKGGRLADLAECSLGLVIKFEIFLAINRQE